MHKNLPNNPWQFVSVWREESFASNLRIAITNVKRLKAKQQQQQQQE